MAANWYPRTKD